MPVIIGALMALAAAVTSAQTVTGNIVDQLGAGLPGLQVRLYSGANQYTTTTAAGGSFSFMNVTAAGEEPALPTGYSVSDNYPNPFNPRTRIRVAVPASATVRVDIYNVLGQRVLGDVERNLRPGESDIDLELRGLPSGLYIARICLDDRYTQIRKMMLVYGSQHLPGGVTESDSRAGNSTQGPRSLMETKLDSLVVTGSTVARTTFAPLPDLAGDYLDLGNLVITLPPPEAPLLSSPPDDATDQPTSHILSWNPAPGGTLYRLQVSTESSFTDLVRDQSDLTDTSAVVGGLDISTPYYWRVSATSSYGTSHWSATWKFTTRAEPGDQLFIYQGAYDALGTVDQVARLAALHDYVVVTHGFTLDGSGWVNGSCLDVGYVRMPELLVTVRQINPKVKIFVYVPATADHPNGCWPQPSVQMPGCPGGDCADFKRWTDLWLSMEDDYPGITIDGVYIDLVHPALIGDGVRDSVYSYVKSRNKIVMANALSDTLGLLFAASSALLQPDDYLLIEGYSCIAGYPNTQTPAMNRLLQNLNIRWAALASEWYNTPLICGSDNMKTAYDLFTQYEGSAFAYQSADLGTQSGTWVYCGHPPK